MVSQLETLLSDITSTEMRLATTVALALAAIGFGWIVVPRIVELSRELVAEWSAQLLDGRAATVRETLVEALPIEFSLRLFVGVLQIVLFVAPAAAILVVWGQFDLVILLLPFAQDAASIAALLDRSPTATAPLAIASSRRKRGQTAVRR
ncbi:MAG: hypothetical protein ACQETB_09045 [Halobacteriota archaeon]